MPEDLLPSLTEYPSYMERAYSDIQYSAMQPVRTEHSLLSFLATAQALNVGFLPMTWQSGRRLLGTGGTSLITQHIISMHTSFAFKRLKPKDNRKMTDADLYQMCTRELEILSSTRVRGHPNIVQLLGICWDTSWTNLVRPVLVFEKSQFGDLYNFCMLPVGKGLNLVERSKLLQELSFALLDMHSLRIIHGDVKPENVLVLKQYSGEYVLKLTDFGYSTQYTADDQLTYIPISQPWNAPEHTRYLQKWTIADAQSMDYFSFSMMSLWFLFNEQLSRLTNTTELEPENMSSLGESYYKTDKSVVVLLKSKEVKALPELASKVIDIERNETILLDKASEASPQHYDVAAVESLSELFDEWEGVLCEQLQDNPSDRPLPETEESPTLLEAGQQAYSDFEETDFKLESSLFDLYDCDYRVRISIADCLKELVDRLSQYPALDIYAEATFQLALSYKIGFGVKREEEMVINILGENSNCMQGLQEIVKEGVKYPDRLGALSTLLNVDPSSIPLSRLSFYEHYLEHGMLQKATSWLSQELEDLSSALGEDNNLALLVADTLSSLLVEQGNWKEAEKLQRPTVKVKIRSFGAAHHFTWQSWTVVGKILRNSGRTQLARDLFISAVSPKSIPTSGRETVIIKLQSELLNYQAEEDFKMLANRSELLVQLISGILGEDHLITLKTQETEALILKMQGLWQEAESLERIIWEKKKRVFIKGHPELLLVMSRLSSTLCSQNKWEEAEELEVQAMQQRLDVLGIDHPDMLLSMSNLVTILGNFNQWEKAEWLNAQLMRVAIASLGPEQYETCASVFNLGKAIAAQGRWREAWRMMKAAISAWKIHNTWSGKLPSWFMPDGAADYLRVWFHLAEDNSRFQGIAVIEDEVISLSKELGENNPRITNVLDTIKELRTNQLAGKLVSAHKKPNRQTRRISRGLQSLLDQIASMTVSPEKAGYIELEDFEAVSMQWEQKEHDELNDLMKRATELKIAADKAFVRRPNGTVAKHVRPQLLGSQCPTPSAAGSQSSKELPESLHSWPEHAMSDEDREFSMLAKSDLRSQDGHVPASDQDHSSTYPTHGSNVTGIYLKSPADPNIQDGGRQRMGGAASNQKFGLPYRGYGLGFPGDSSESRQSSVQGKTEDTVKMNKYTGLWVDAEPLSSISGELPAFTQDDTTLEQSMVQEDLRRWRETEMRKNILESSKEYTNSWLDPTQKPKVEKPGSLISQYLGVDDSE